VGRRWLADCVVALGLPFAIVMAAAVWRSRADREGLWVTALWLCTLLLSCGVQWLSGWNLVGIAVGASISWYVVPAAAKAWASKNVSGVAAGSWWVLSAEGGLFLGYGLLGGAWASIIYGVVAITGSAVVLARIALGRVAPQPPRRPAAALPSTTDLRLQGNSPRPTPRAGHAVGVRRPRCPGEVQWHLYVNSVDAGGR
jgi:hypothetical protein